MAFIQCTDLHANFRCLYTIKPIQILLNSSSHEQIYSTLIIRQCNIWRIGTIIQFDKATLNNIALVNGGIDMKKHHYFTTTFLHNGTAQSLSDRFTRGTIDHSSMWQIFCQQNTRFVPENDHDDLFNWCCSTKSSRCFFTCLLPDLDFVFTEGIVIV